MRERSASRPRLASGERSPFGYDSAAPHFSASYP